MQKTFSHCDWCKKLAFVEKLTYMDGFVNSSCGSCKQTALIDVKRYNHEERVTPQKESLSGHRA
ncbi:hypothetical protein AB4343_03870 [Vibrio breoganii]|uniref:Uncharacterized protein n=1 Tax=Vibrio breoganii TaxID=553239 RepID=A0AAJ5EI73_9VIBR|nr:hypothetical protein [Vibrio breoganii]ANO32767.1 hypothetical protein A6E01_05945 [Vibrio breoganii]MDN3714809.1 hypothetical protein [Vibrio breoganii]NMO73414.1 hypothetical protein [Vibrio breoganii]NMR70037.1 hypothetical protein [Vibrio breoganii]OCH74609.1 hypothetical protein A6D95_13645 [Vibrio breoganii]